MSTSRTPYRGTPTYVHVVAELVRAAQYRGLTTYQDVAVIMGLPTHGSFMGSSTSRILGEICEEEVQAGRPMLSAVAVSVAGQPGPGFFELAKRLGRMPADEAESAFWQRERDAVYATWKRSLPKAPAKNSRVTSA